jgi:predicted ribonuclease YlaK
MVKTLASSKIFVLDTNVVLHDYMCIYNFQDNDLALPNKMKNQSIFTHINLLKGERSKLAELASDLL